MIFPFRIGYIPHFYVHDSTKLQNTFQLLFSESKTKTSLQVLVIFDTSLNMSLKASHYDSHFFNSQISWRSSKSSFFHVTQCLLIYVFWLIYYLSDFFTLPIDVLTFMLHFLKCINLPSRWCSCWSAFWLSSLTLVLPCI